MGVAYPSLEICQQASDAYARACAALQEELLGYLAERMRIDNEARLALTKCKSWEEVAQAQHHWLISTALGFFGEMTRLVQMASKAAPDAMGYATEAPRPAASVHDARPRSAKAAD